MSGDKKQIWGSHLSQKPDEAMVRFCAGRDVAPLPMADEVLLPYDLWVNRAHAIMLFQQNILSGQELTLLLEGLSRVEAGWEAGTFKLDPEKEDVHVNVEHFITQTQGEVGGKLHTGRSRNDQVSTGMRLLMRQEYLNLAVGLAGLVGLLLDKAQQEAATVMPGFTHTQPDMATSWGHWQAAWAQALLRDLERIQPLYGQVNRSPLGAAASFGTSWPINREATAGLLGFDRVDANTLDCITARWEHEYQLASQYASVMSHLSIMAQDLVLLSHPYWAMVRLADSYVTGSSIMPQKRNPDFAEVVRGKTAWLAGMVNGLLGVAKGGMSGYNRDSQVTKYAVMDVLRECREAPLVMRGAVESLAPDRQAMRNNLAKGFLDAADFADALARTLAIPFRQSYNVAAAAVGLSGEAGAITPQAAGQALSQAGLDPQAAQPVLKWLGDPDRLLEWRTHTGAPSPEKVRQSVAAMREELAAFSAWVAPAQAKLDGARQACWAFRP